MLGRERDGLCSGVGNLRQQKDVRGSREDGPERNRSDWRVPGAPGVRTTACMCAQSRPTLRPHGL